MKQSDGTSGRASQEGEKRGRPPGSGRGARVDLGHMRVSGREREMALAVGQLYLESDTLSDLAYRIWRRGLTIDLARLASVSGQLPGGLSEDELAVMIAQDLLHCIPLLRRTGKLALLQLSDTAAQAVANEPEGETIDSEAADNVRGLGGADFI